MSYFLYRRDSSPEKESNSPYGSNQSNETEDYVQDQSIIGNFLITLLFIDPDVYKIDSYLCCTLKDVLLIEVRFNLLSVAFILFEIFVF